MVVIVNARPLAIPWIVENIPAIVEAWEPGAFGGQALAEILFGQVNPSGKLPITIPRNVGQILCVYNHKPSMYAHKYNKSPTKPLWWFGHGLSYTTFAYRNLQVPSESALDESFTVSVEVANTGSRAGEEVVLLYFKDRVSSVTTPVKRLLRFDRVALAPGEVKQVSFELQASDLALLDQQLKSVTEPGEFVFSIGKQTAVMRYQGGP